MAAPSEPSETIPAVTTVTESARPPTAKVSTLRKVIPFVLACALLTYVGSQLKFAAFVDALRGLDVPAFLAFALAWQFALLAADALGNYATYRLTMPQVRYFDFYVIRGASYLPGLANHHLGQAYMTYLMSKLVGLPLARVTGATLVSYAGWMGCLLGCEFVALLVSGLPLEYLPMILIAGILYLAVVHLKPARLAKFTFLSPLFEAGLKGHAVSLLARLPHLGVLLVGAWGAYRFFHVDIPVGTALLYLPIMFVATTLPFTPQGAGVREALAPKFFLKFSPGETDPERIGRLTAATTSWLVATTLSAVLVWFVCSRFVARRLLAGRA